MKHLFSLVALALLASCSTATPAPNGNASSSASSAYFSCTKEAKVCPDGTVVGRTGPNCEFTPCPE